MFFIWRSRRILKKLFAVSETLKKNNRHFLQIDTFCLFQQLFANKDFSMEKILCNIFETANAAMLAKTILESPYKVLQSL